MERAREFRGTAMTDRVQFTPVYGPVRSWRYGRSLGIDPIGSTSTCSFNCVYCQLGAIERLQRDRQVFIPTAQIVNDLNRYDLGEVDCLTLSGSGEPTLALNLGEILQNIKKITQKPLIVLTNGTLLHDPNVRRELCLANQVAVKLDALDSERLKRINRPVTGLDLTEILRGIEEFRQQYAGEMAIQTMILTDWDENTCQEYIQFLERLQPLEIQLNTPSRPKPVGRQLDGRGNHSREEVRPYEVQKLKCVSQAILRQLAAKIEGLTAIPVRYAP
jgi:wyosine [tRNA(Phe)-imidazoG37] synthetase (radical SAM superfamily)